MRRSRSRPDTGRKRWRDIDTGSRAATEQRALAWLAIVAVIAIAWIASPFAASVLFGALLAFTLEPLQKRLSRLTRRPRLIAATNVVATGAAIVCAFVGFTTLFVRRAPQLASEIQEQLRQGGAFDFATSSATHWLARVGLNTASITTRIESTIGDIAASGGKLAAGLAFSTFNAALGLFFALLTMYVVLLEWKKISAATVAVSPLDELDTKLLLRQFRRVGRSTLSSIVLTAVTQGVLSTIGYMIARVPYPAFFGIATGIASLVPAVGTLLVWVPVSAFLFVTGHHGAAIFLVCWGALVVVILSDYYIRPRLVGRESMPTIAVLISLFGGLELLGFAGLIVGPLIMSMATTVLRRYARRRARTRRHT